MPKTQVRIVPVEEPGKEEAGELETVEAGEPETMIFPDIVTHAALEIAELVLRYENLRKWVVAYFNWSPQFVDEICAGVSRRLAAIANVRPDLRLTDAAEQP